MISFACTQCGQQLSVKDEFAGKTGKCPHCKQPALVPSSTAPIKLKNGGTKSTAVPRAQPTLAGSPSAKPPAERHTLSSESDESQKDDYNFLAPPQRGDELGRLGVYRVLKVLGAGGMGVVFKAEDPQLERPVALKAMRPALAASPSARQRFLREAKSTAAIKHDHIVSIYQVGEDRNIPFLAMEFLEGEALDEYLKREEKMSVPEVLRVGREMAEGLSAAHARGLIHRDVKPGNVWLEKPKGRVKILDFGLARAPDDDSHITQAGAVIGTPAFMSPEQASNETLDARSDLFSLGCVLYRLITGRLPFRGTDTISTLRALALETPPAPDALSQEVPSGLSRLIVRLLAKAREERPGSAREVIEVLTALEQEWNQPAAIGTELGTAPEVVETPVEAKGKRPGKPARGRRGVLLAVGGLAGMLLLATAVFFGLRSTDGKTDGVQPADKNSATFLASVAGLDKEFTNSIGMKMVLIPPGTFQMGSSSPEADRKTGEYRVHTVIITKPFYMGAHEVAQAHYEKMTGKNPSRFPVNKGGGPNHPVEKVSWSDAEEFCKQLAALAAEKKAGRAYRLPTEAEWEYSCRAGTQTPFFFGNDPANMDEYAWTKQNAGSKTHPIGVLKPNPWGLYDIYGNVAEWCSDRYSPDYYAELSVKDPQGPDTGDRRVVRGSVYSSGGHLRSSSRQGFASGEERISCGLRVVCPVPVKP